MNEPKWIRFVEGRPERGRKTKIWTVHSLDGPVLGLVKFYGAWRQYAFFPEFPTLFEPRCLRDIADFCQAETASWRVAKRAAKAEGLSKSQSSS